ncbi:hypothetical protein G7B40_024930 [Aetokthonos hydrillicola Thurmond2011]|jgi:hypothetical protein|uniref:Uncharacterized protein n=1 Tax=Aetokthonos hydrillicola Thurmond2011 TaxID=2712845 RepID=A0AAP5MBC6_9CYAN|nr:hypothetical protein [Aetokthonos hydrillicola]MBO3458498.1 hypothetical protein [Aetokthonos hydrillicola CCALA 1050]MBW4586175.1 hypothetical protein [Aetokthonos hydrillicola CCALA 1050]MDR9897782.1 hypothetical protein [Aetokthonos hydrillicola Thurmond2011]
MTKPKTAKPLPPSDTQVDISVEVIEPEELTEEESRLRLHLERKVERAFYEAGKALLELRDKRLFRSSHRTFEEYCKDRFGFERRHPYRLIDAAAVVDNLTQMCPDRTQIETEVESDEMCPIRTQILPTNEYQIRPLTKLEPSKQRSAWQMAVQAANNRLPSHRIVKDIVQSVMERTRVPNPYRSGEVCQILPKDNPELRGKGGCWCIVRQVNDFSCTVMSWDREYTVRMDHLKSLEYSDADCERMQSVCDRITRLRSCSGLEAAAYANLKHLGELKRPYLTPLEEKLLGLLEQEYRIATQSDVL